MFTKLKEENPNRIEANCCCHILHNCAKYGFKLLKYDVEILALIVYADFFLSSKSSEELRSFCQFAQQEILCHIIVWWLSLQSPVEHLVKMWQVLKMYYWARGEEKTHPAIWKFISSQQNEINEYSLSLSECFFVFFKCNTTYSLQSNNNFGERRDTFHRHA